MFAVTVLKRRCSVHWCIGSTGRLVYRLSGSEQYLGDYSTAMRGSQSVQLRSDVDKWGHPVYTRAVCKVRGLTLLLRVGTLWRCGYGLFFEVLPLASDALLTTLHPLLGNVLQTVDHFEISCLGAPFSWLEKPLKSHGARSELNFVFGLGKVDRWNPIRTSAIQSRSRPMRFLGFPNHEEGARRQETSKWTTVCSTFSRSGWSVVRIASLAKAGTSKKRPSPHLHRVPSRSNKVSPQTSQTALVYVRALYKRPFKLQYLCLMWRYFT
jgi:hypothetical protein